MAVNNNMIYTRVCVDCGKVMPMWAAARSGARSAALYISG